MTLAEAEFILDNREDYDDDTVTAAVRCVEYHTSNRWGR